MADWKERLRKERDDLVLKISKLEVFTQSYEYQKLSDNQRMLLTEQLSAMGEYASILGERLFLNGDPDDEDE